MRSQYLFVCLCFCLFSPLARARAQRPGSTPPGPPIVQPQNPKGVQFSAGAATGKVPPAAVKAANMFDRAVKLQQAGKMKDALAAYQELVKFAPGAFPAWMNMGIIYQSGGDFENAEKAYMKAASIEPKNALPASQLAGLYLGHKKWAEAKTQAERAIKLDPKNPQAHFALAGAFTGLNDGAGAEREYREAARIAPGNARAHFNLASILAMQQKSEAAIAEYQRAVKLDPKLGVAHLYLGIAYQKKKDYAAAMTAYRNAVASMPTNAAAQFNLGTVYQEEGERTKDERLQNLAITAYLRTIELNPKMPGAHLNIGRMYFKLQKYDLAAKHIALAAELDPKNSALLSDVALARTWAAYSEKDPIKKKEFQKEAEEQYSRAIASKPTPQSFSGLAYLYEQMGQQDKAAETYEKMASKFPKDGSAFLSLGRIRESQGKRPEAEKAFKKAVEIDPKSTQARDSLARFYENQRKNEEAANEFKKLVALDPTKPEPHRNLAALYQRQRRTAEAIAEYEETLKLDPKDSTALYSLASIFESDKKYDEAIRRYRKAVDANPKDINPRASIARILESQGKLDSAIAEYREIEKIAPGDSARLSNIPRILELQGKTQAALDEATRLLGKNPSSSDLKAKHADLLVAQGKMLEAAKEYEGIADGDKSAMWAWLRVGAVYEKLKKYDLARAAFLRAMEDKRNEFESYNHLAQLYEIENRLEAWAGFLRARIRENNDSFIAINHFETVSMKLKQEAVMLSFLKDIAGGRAQNDKPYQLYYGSLAERHKDPTDALDAFRKAATIDPSDYITRARVATLQEGMGRIADAIGTYEEVIKIKNLPPALISQYRVQLAGLYEKNGQQPLALAQYREVLKTEPNNSIAKDAVKRLGG